MSRWALLLALLSCLGGLPWTSDRARAHALEDRASVRSALEQRPLEQRSPERRPLDLPSGGVGSTEEDDSLETIVLYGSTYEGDGFFWCLDRSCSMGWGGAWPILAAEVADAIEDLSDTAWFGLVAYGSSTTRYSTRPLRAQRANALGARIWLEDLEPSGSSCLLPAALEMIEQASRAECARPAGIIVSDGLPFCDGFDTSATCSAVIPGAVRDPLVVHTLYVSEDTPGIAFLEGLAQACGGTFRTVGGNP